MAQYRIDTNQMLESNKTIYEVMMLADSEGNVTGGGNFHGSAVDAFGRARFSQPFTLFDSTNIYETNEKWSYANTGATANVGYSVNESTVTLNVGTASGDEVVRETKRVFSYQPGKSLLTMNTFVLNPAKENLRQRVGYFTTQNGIYLELDGTDVYLVKRNYASGSIVETRVAQADWNGDTLNGNADTSTSGLVLDLTKSQILWQDFEWLGVGTARCGFVINGQLIIAHKFHNANIYDTVYMTSPNLPIRYEITNTGTTASTSTLKQICSTAISEGGYEARAVLNSIGGAISGVTVGTDWTNLATIRLDPNTLNAVIVPSGFDVLNISNSDFEYGLFFNVTPGSAWSWTNATTRVEYSLQAITFTGGRRIASGYLGGKTAPSSIGDGYAWDYQLGRTLAGVSDTLTLGVRTNSSSKTAAGIIKWFELG